MSAFGDLLRECREQRQLPQRTLSESANINQALISRFETGDRLPSGPEQVLALARALQLNDSEADTLLAAAGYWPRVYVELGPRDQTLLLVARFLTDPAIPPEKKDRFRQLLVLLAQEWLAP